jgi:hypothetical protein
MSEANKKPNIFKRMLGWLTWEPKERRSEKHSKKLPVDEEIQRIKSQKPF